MGVLPKTANFCPTKTFLVSLAFLAAFKGR